MQLRHLALGLGAFVAGTAALAAGAVALATRKPGEGAADDTTGPTATTAAPDAQHGPTPNVEQSRAHDAPTTDGHAAPDLAADAEPGARAPAAFRPDIDAPMTAAEREALRPATGPQPTLIDAGTSMPAGD